MTLALSFAVGDHCIGNWRRPFVIAEAGSNFNQNLDTGKRLIDAAALSGASAVKFQLFRADELYPDRGSAHAAFKAVELNPDWVPHLSEHAKVQDLVFMASAFDPKSLQVLENVSTLVHKVASSELTNLKLVRKMARTGKPLIMSTGMCDLGDVHNAIEVAGISGCSEIALMQCGAVYPLPLEDVHIRAIDLMRSTFACPVGFSDHTLGFVAAIAAVGCGASIVEKHFTLDKNAVGPDHYFALEPEELTRFVAHIREAYVALGLPVKKMLRQEQLEARRSGLYAARDIASGTILSREDIISRRPAIGVRDRFESVVLGTKCMTDIPKDAAITWDAMGD